jgi:hypothetical protein
MGSVKSSVGGFLCEKSVAAVWVGAYFFRWFLFLLQNLFLTACLARKTWLMSLAEV